MWSMYLRKLITPSTVWFWIFTILVYLFLFKISIHYIGMYINNTYNDSIYHKLQVYESISSPNRLDTLCVITNCKHIVSTENGKDNLYKYIQEDNKLVLEYEDITPDLVEALKGSHSKYYHVGIVRIFSDEPFLQEMILKYVDSAAIGTAIGLLLILFTYHTYMWLKDNYRRRELKENLIDHIQKGLTESLHHEIGNPVVVLSNVFENVLNTMFPCYALNGYKNVPADECKICHGKDHLVPPPSVIESIESINMSFDRINAILNLLSRSKYVKYTAQPITLSELLKLTVAEREKLNISRTAITLKNKELLSKLYLCNGFENGLLVNVVTSMLTNSIEAGATNITIDSMLEGRNRLNIFIRDNGHGVLDKNGRLINSNVIFKYGFSTKETKNNLRTLSLGKRIKNWILGISNHPKTTRGFGLSINKAILGYYGGDLELYENTEYGATFRMMIYVTDKPSNPID